MTDGNLFSDLMRKNPLESLNSKRSDHEDEVEEEEEETDAVGELNHKEWSGSNAKDCDSRFNVANGFEESPYQLKEWTAQTYYQPFQSESVKPVIFIAHHGAGSSGLTFTLLAKELVSISKDSQNNSGDELDIPGFFCFDMRGHGQSKFVETVESKDYSIQTLCVDFINILNEFFARNEFDAVKCRPSIFFIGHSLGGSILTKILKEDMIENQFIKDCIKGLVLLDIVEEIAVKALDGMQGYIEHRPKSFASLSDALQWHLDSGLLHNEESGLISIPFLFSKREAEGSPVYEWVTDLKSTKPYWKGWFTGLSNGFITISSRIAKMLVLSNHENLDKYLTIGQMQGKFQLVVFRSQQNSQFGHFIHEDIPNKVAYSILDFVDRNDFTRPKSVLHHDEGSSQRELIQKLNAKWGVKN
ncbi:hypothetical protein LJB42_001064 [Komagataella kurtzmanii]|nr:hypothetical protein LJB42_001064 [Komagataella kurtzmanii]